MPARSTAAARTSGCPQRRKGLVASSSAIVDGTVGSPRSRRASASCWRRSSSAFCGSTARAKRRFDSVYSCAQNTRVAAGSAARRASLPVPFVPLRHSEPQARSTAVTLIRAVGDRRATRPLCLPSQSPRTDTRRRSRRRGSCRDRASRSARGRSRRAGRPRRARTAARVPPGRSRRPESTRPRG